MARVYVRRTWVQEIDRIQVTAAQGDRKHARVIQGAHAMSSSTVAPTLPVDLADRAPALQRAGLAVLRYGLVFLLLLFGSFKFAAFEAEGIRPLLEHSPLMSWMLAAFGGRGASDVLGVVEIATGLAIASRRWLPRASGLASLAASGIFVVTLSFLVTTPGILEPTSAMGGFVLKDLILLGAALFTAGEALAASRTA
jgi:uncharacterized membrane protein YkgB